jgi:hypothetical protein
LESLEKEVMAGENKSFTFILHADQSKRGAVDCWKKDEDQYLKGQRTRGKGEETTLKEWLRKWDTEGDEYGDDGPTIDEVMEASNEDYSWLPPSTVEPPSPPDHGHTNSIDLDGMSAFDHSRYSQKQSQTDCVAAPFRPIWSHPLSSNLSQGVDTSACLGTTSSHTAGVDEDGALRAALQEFVHRDLSPE